jgi:hypothetical protein
MANDLSKELAASRKQYEKVSAADPAKVKEFTSPTKGIKDFFGSSEQPKEQRKVECPTCAAGNQVKEKVAGKNYFAVPFTDLKVPRLDHLIDKKLSFDENRRDGEVCGDCKGKKEVTDVTDDSAKYQQATEKIQEKAGEIMDLEASLGLGGTRTTFIQGSDLLFVGLGFNNNKTHEVVPNAAIAPSMKGGKIPQQNSEPVNAVVGKQGSIAWPQQVGNYTIKCANSFNLLAGAGGITIATPGSLTFSAGMLKISSPALTLGSSSGPLTLEGQSVNVTGKTVSISPTNGETFIRGNISNTGNITTQGHAHFESMSFVKGSCVSTTKATFMAKANPDVTTTQQATWGAAAASAAILDLKTSMQNVKTDSATSAFRLASSKELQNVSDRIANIAKLSLPFELKPTGWVLPGTTFQALIDGNQRTIQIITPVNLNNFPHTHGIPEMMHLHQITLPDIDYTSDSPQAVRGKTLNGSHETGAPADPTKDTLSRLSETARVAKEFAAQAAVEGTKLVGRVVRFLGF